jgi:hypothetical protein
LATPELLRRLCPADVAGVRSVVNGRFGLVSGLVLLRVVGLVSSSGAREPRPKRLTARGEGPVYQGPTATIPIQAIQKIRPRLRSLAVRLRNRLSPDVRSQLRWGCSAVHAGTKRGPMREYAAYQYSVGFKGTKSRVLMAGCLNGRDSIAKYSAPTFAVAPLSVHA